MKKVVIKSMLVLSLVLAGTMNTTTLLAQTQETQQVEETPAERKAREKAEKKAAKEAEKARRKAEKEAEKARKAAEKAEKARLKEEAKIAKILAAQKKEGTLVQEQQTTTTYGPEWGENATAEQREENVYTFNFFTDAYNNKNYDKALEYMYTLINNCPKARSSVYANGAAIYRNKITRSRSLAEKSAHIDSLMNLYDYRLAAFADDPEYGQVYILKMKAKDYYQYRSEDKQGMLELFRKAIEIDPGVDAGFINQYFKVLVDEYQALNVETDYFMSEYDFMASKMDLVTDAQEKANFDALLINSGAANCEELERIYKERVETNPDDLALVEKVYKLLGRQKCQNDFFFFVGERYLVLNPASATAQVLSANYEAVGNHARAIELLREAIAIESDPMVKSQLCVQIAGSELSAGKGREAAAMAKEAIEYNANNGMAYVVLAQSYTSANCDDFNKLTIYWLAYDLVSKAHGLFAGDEAHQQMCQELMATYKGFFPKQSDCFFRGMQDGTEYNVQCGWVAGSTIVRSQK